MRRFKVVDGCYAHFLTSTIVKWLPIFCEPAVAQIIVESWQYCCQHKGLRLHAYVIMPTHLHWIASADDDLTALVNAFKTHTSKQIARHFDEQGNTAFSNVFRFCGRDNRPPTAHKVWQDGNQPEVIYTQPFF